MTADRLAAVTGVLMLVARHRPPHSRSIDVEPMLSLIEQAQLELNSATGAVGATLGMARPFIACAYGSRGQPMTIGAMD